MATPASFDFPARLQTLLPESYQVFDRPVPARSMGSAALKFGPDGKVPWGEMWASFCHLAMAGGPPHRGTLLEPAHSSAEEMRTDAYQDVVAEIVRGIGLVTGLCAEASAIPGWLRMYCTSAAMASWLERAIVMENVCAVAQGLQLFLPVGPAFRVEKEIKNVITSVAKGCHYWQDHTPEAQRDAIAALLRQMERTTPRVPLSLTPLDPEAVARLADALAPAVEHHTGLQTAPGRNAGWLGMECGTVAAAVWRMRALACCNLLVRREESVVLVPLNPASDPDGVRTLDGIVQAHRLAAELDAATPARERDASVPA